MNETLEQPIKVHWVCRQSNARGQIVLPTGVSKPLDEIVGLVADSHAIECGYPGAVSVLCDLERREGMCVASRAVCTFGFQYPHLLPPLLVVLHLAALRHPQ